MCGFKRALHFQTLPYTALQNNRLAVGEVSESRSQKVMLTDDDLSLRFVVLRCHTSNLSSKGSQATCQASTTHLLTYSQHVNALREQSQILLKFKDLNVLQSCYCFQL